MPRHKGSQEKFLWIKKHEISGDFRLLVNRYERIFKPLQTSHAHGKALVTQFNESFRRDLNRKMLSRD